MAFQNYNIFKGTWGSEFVGFDNFVKLFNYGDFIRIFINTMAINILDLLIQFPAPIILALLINEVNNNTFKRVIQSTIYLPHFLSWVVLGGIITSQFLSPTTGIINLLLKHMGMEPIYFLIKSEYARGIVIATGLFREVGWGTILYLAATSGINPSLYEAAEIDGAGKLRQTLSVTLPSLIPIMVVVFLIKIGHFFDYGFDRIYIYLNGANMSKIDIFDTYVYRVGLQECQYSYATAVGLFKSLCGVILLGGANTLSRKTTGESIF
jgi:putative aldouronate transport system permease protein